MVFLAEGRNISHTMASSIFLQTTASWAHDLSVSNQSELSPHIEQKAEQLVSEATLSKVTFVFGMVLIPILAIFGVVGNILSLVVLVQHRMRSTTNICLAALAVSDLLLLLHSLAFSAIRIHSLRDPVGALKARQSTFPVLGAYGSIVCARITTWLTTMLGVERCIAVYLPLKAKSINSRRSTLLAIVAIYLLTCLAFLPTALQYEVVQVKGPHNITQPKLQLSSLGHNQSFMVPYSVMLNTLFRFIPLVVLIVVNTLITAAIRRTSAIRRNLSWSRGHNANGREQNRITLMLLTVSGVFLLCTLPGAINTIVSRITPDYSRLGSEGNLYLTLSIVTYFLETLNSSINFIIYMAFSRKFSNTYQEIFCCRSSPWQPWQMSLRTVRFVPRGPSSTSLQSSYEMQCRQYRSFPNPHFPTSSGAHHTRFLTNGFIRSSFDAEDQQLLKSLKTNGITANGNIPIHGTCCTCRQENRCRSLSRSRSQSHSSESAAQQYS